MKSPKKLSACLGVLVLICFGFHGTVFAADADKCTAITSVPFTISASGSYCLANDISTPATFTAGNAITVSVNDVVIDLGGFTLGNLSAGTGTQAVGIFAQDQKNVTVQNGTVRGFCRGIDLLDSGTVALVASRGHLVENVRVDMSRCLGIVVEGTSSVIRNNQVVGTGTKDSAIGIYAVGIGVHVLDNEVADTFRPSGLGNGYGIFIDTLGTGAVIEGNVISNDPSDFGLGSGSIGILANATDVLVVNNRLTWLNFGIFYASGGNGKFRDNLTSGVTTAYRFLGGTDAGNNN